MSTHDGVSFLTVQGLMSEAKVCLPPEAFLAFSALPGPPPAYVCPHPLAGKLGTMDQAFPRFSG